MFLSYYEKTHLKIFYRQKVTLFLAVYDVFESETLQDMDNFKNICIFDFTYYLSSPVWSLLASGNRTVTLMLARIWSKSTSLMVFH